MNQTSMTAFLKHFPKNKILRDKLCGEFSAYILFKIAKNSEDGY